MFAQVAEAGHGSQASACDDGDACEAQTGSQGGQQASVQVGQAPPAPPAIGDRDAGEDEGEELGMFGPDRPDPEDIRAGEDMSAEAWAAGSGEWPPPDPWVRRGLHNLVTRMTEELDAAVCARDGLVTVRASDLDNVLMVAVSALYEAGSRSRQIEAEAG